MIRIKGFFIVLPNAVFNLLIPVVTLSAFNELTGEVAPISNSFWILKKKKSAPTIFKASKNHQVDFH